MVLLEEKRWIHFFHSSLEMRVRTGTPETKTVTTEKEERDPYRHRDLD